MSKTLIRVDCICMNNQLDKKIAIGRGLYSITNIKNITNSGNSANSGGIGVNE